MGKFIVINKRKIGEDFPVFIVAEVSANHGQDFRRAAVLIKKAKECGADAVKFQLYSPDTLTIDADNKYFRVKHAQWGGQTLYQLYKKAYTPWNWFKDLKKISDDLGILFFATAFDRTAVDFLEELRVPVHKIASFELIDIPLIRYAAKTRKPLILSTGMANASEIKEAISAARSAGTSRIMLLKCVSNYPAAPEDMSIRAIPRMRKRFGLPIGLSDHSLGMGVSIAAVCLDAVMVEKHFILSRNIKTPDSFFSMEPDEFRSMVDNIRITEAALRDHGDNLGKEEKRGRISRRSLFVSCDMKRGELFTPENVRSVRPGHGILPKYLDDVLGSRSKREIRRGTPLQWSLVLKKRKAQG